MDKRWAGILVEKDTVLPILIKLGFIVFATGLFVVIVPPRLMMLAFAMGLVAMGYVLLKSYRALMPRTTKTITPVTKQPVEVSEEHNRMVTLINNLADAVISIDESGVITLFNAATLNILDTNKALDGAHIDSIFNLVDDSETPVKLFEKIVKAKGVTVDDTLRMTQNDETLRLEFTYAPIRSGYESGKTSASGYIVIVRDVTRLKSLEEERDEFISVVSHELRTPITVAEGTISNVQLMMERGGYDQTVLEKNLVEAHEQVLYLARMINDLSTLSRAERGIAAEVESIDVTQLAHDLYNEYAPSAEKAGLHLNLELGHRLGSVSTSRLYLHELLQNFITNGIKYTKQGSVTLHISRKNNLIIFSVTDTGIGIGKTDQARVFEKFFRSEDYRTRETGGTGLGLYVAAKLSHKLHTKIELKSRLNHGSTFSFALPVEK